MTEPAATSAPARSRGRGRRDTVAGRVTAWIVLAAGLGFLTFGLLLHAGAYEDVARAGGNAHPAQLAAGLQRATRIVAFGVPLTVVGALLLIRSFFHELRDALTER